jgi:hypothetical protein
VKEALKRLIDPYSVIQNMIGAAMVVMAYDKQGAVNDILAYYKEHVERSKGSNVKITYGMCEALAVCAAVNKDKALAMKIIGSLGDVITKAKENLNKGVKPADQKDILSQSYFWKGNLESWFYSERSETGDVSALNDAKADYDSAINANPDNIPALVERENVAYRIANIEYKLGLRQKTPEQYKSIAAGLAGSYDQVITNLKKFAEQEVKVAQVRRMSDRDVKMRKAQYIAAQAKAYLLLGSAAVSAINLTEPNKVRVRTLNDGIQTEKSYYLETRVSLGDVINPSQVEKINAGRKAQVDEYGKTVFAGENSTKYEIGTEAAKDAVIDPANLLTALGSLKREGLLGAALGWYKKASEKADAVQKNYNLSLLEQRDYGIDNATLYGNEIMDKAILSILIPTNENLLMIAAAIDKAKEAYNAKQVDLLKVRVWEANLKGWISMAAEDTKNLTATARLYDDLKNDYKKYGLTMEADTLLNYGDVLSLIYYKGREGSKLSDAIAVLEEVSDSDRSTTGAMADIKLANLLIGAAGTKKPAERKEDYDKAEIHALRALQRLTGSEEGRSFAFCFDKIQSSPTLKKDKLVIQALCYAAMSKAWSYTLMTAKERVGKLKPVTVNAAETVYGMKIDRDGLKLSDSSSIQVGESHLAIRKLLCDVYKIAADKKFVDLEGDMNLRLLVHEKSPSGLPYVIREIKKSYGISSAEKPSALKASEKELGEDAENKYFYEVK